MRQQSQLGRFGQDEQTTDARVIRAATHGRMLNEPPEPAPGGPGFRKPSTGRFVGYRFEEPGVERQSDTGEFVATGDARPISKREAIARYGHPDGDGGDVPPSPFGRSRTPQTFDGQANDQLEAGVDREQLHRTELFGAQATASDVSASAEELFDAVGGGGVSALGGRTPHESERSPSVPMDDAPPGEEPRDLFETADDVGVGSGPFGPFDDEERDELEETFQSSQDRIAGERQRGVKAVEEFNRGGMGLRELGSELEGSNRGADPFEIGAEGSEATDRGRQEFDLPDETVSFARTRLNEEVFGEGRDDLDDLRQRMTVGEPVELDSNEFQTVRRVVSEGRQDAEDRADRMDRNIFGDTDEQAERARRAEQDLINNPPSFGGGWR